MEKHLHPNSILLKLLRIRRSLAQYCNGTHLWLGNRCRNSPKEIAVVSTAVACVLNGLRVNVCLPTER